MKQAKTSKVTMFAGTPIDENVYYMASTLDNLDSDINFTRLFTYDDQATASKQWFHHDLPDWAVVSTCLIPGSNNMPRKVCALSEEGDIEICSSAGRVVEKIKDAGLYGTGKNLGYLNRIRHIECNLFACGYNGQIYKRTSHSWELFNLGIPCQVRTQPTLNSETKIDLLDINGQEASSIYTVGDEGFIAHYDGTKWSTLPIITKACLYGIFIDSNGETWITGSNGTILQGSSKNGFHVIQRKPLDCDFYSMTEFNGHHYIGASDGVYLLSNNRLSKISLPHPATEIDSIDVINNILWALGSKHLMRFDGLTWQIIEHIDNI
ncbi:hypothetical protein LJD21_01025 [Pseudomonas inefficax]|jgi:hypothetical protein|uniref:hypothetical protein n=1 Tax=Pseudomonas inefficax TaxID=2078786 RepID=UPI00207BB1B1|nr:hypothetical protein [Pseudomonas inefficax]MCM8910751.1 hypothetical protein [Pseudomonas inefficax]